jgi:membrane fusion protein, type I secretion system
VIHQLAAHTVGRDIRAGDAIMEIVPDKDVDRGKAAAQGHRPVYADQKAFLRFSTFDQRITPQLAGTISTQEALRNVDRRCVGQGRCLSLKLRAVDRSNLALAAP